MVGRRFHSSKQQGATAPPPGREAGVLGINGIYGDRAENAMRRMLGPQGHTVVRESKALPILGRATVEGTRYTVNRSRVFEHWRHQCTEPVGWHLSKLGCATCKMVHDLNEAVESLRLQINKSCNSFELDSVASDIHQSVARAMYDILQAFELDRSRFVIVVRCGVIRQPPLQAELMNVETSNTAAVRNRVVHIFEGFKLTSLSSMQLKSGLQLSELTDEHLQRMSLRRSRAPPWWA